MESLILTYEEVKSLSDWREYIEDVEKALRATGEGKGWGPPVRIYHQIPGDLAWIYVVAGAGLEERVSSVKLLTLNYDNPGARALAHMYGILILMDALTGVPLAIMDGVYITYARTGALAAMGAKYLAPRDSERVAVIGARDLARSSLLAMQQVLPKIRSVSIYSKTPANREALAREVTSLLGVDVAAVASAEEAVNLAQVIVTATSASEPVIYDQWVRAGSHISGIGSKKELDPAILSRARIIPETLAECKLHGKAAFGLEKGTIEEQDIGPEMTQVVAGKQPGRTARDQLTVFDSIGLALEDALIAWRIYGKARQKGVGSWVDFFGGVRPW